MAFVVNKEVLVNVLGLIDKKADESLKNEKLVQKIQGVLDEAAQAGLTPENVDKLPWKTCLYDIATTYPDEAVKHRSLIVRYAVENKLNKSNFVLAKNYLKKNKFAESIDTNEFEQECGIGVEITRERIIEVVNAHLDKVKEELDEKGYSFGYGNIMKDIRDELKFADTKDIKDELDKALEVRLGPKDQAEKKPVVKKPVEKKPVVKEVEAEHDTLPENVELHDPKDNPYCPPELLEAHLKRTGGKIITRFPPEPNGYLHIGHAKSMNLNFGYARKKGGYCYMRFDDTNPEKERQEYIDSILGSVEWLGHKPYKITYSSDYFQQLFDFAVELIKRDKAYICHQTGEQMAEGRRTHTPSPWRDRPVEESLRLFYDMKNGKFEEGAAVLRMKGDMSSVNPTMRDMVAYRIKYKPHPHVGDRWCIYPSYDFTHCIIDSLEDITHSLCTLEFEVRRETYIWLLKNLDIYIPPQIEFSRLNITNHVMSKRKLTLLVEKGYVRGWDDPRMATIDGLKRRGYTPESINKFCEKVGVTRNSGYTNLSLLERSCRDHLNQIAPRAMAVLEPLKVTITNFEGGVKELVVPNHPLNEAMGTHTVPLSNVIYIEKSDFRTEDSKSYYRLAPGKEVGLKYFSDGNIKATDFKTDENGNVVEVLAEIVPKNKVKAHIHWIAEPAPGVAPLKVEVRKYANLFNVEKPGDEEDFLKCINPESLVVIPEAYVDSSVKGAKVYDKFQFERHGYFSVDPDSTEDKLIFNLTVNLMEDKSKE